MPDFFVTIRIRTVRFRLRVVNVEYVNLMDGACVNMRACARNSVPRYSITQNDGMFSDTDLTL
jgi:hypothetical protein